MEAQFSVEHSQHVVAGREVVVLALQGQLAAETYMELQTALEAIGAEAPAEPRVVLDCAGLDYVSSAGLGVLSKTTKEFRERQGDLRLAAMREQIFSIVKLLGFDQVIKCFAGVDEAIASFAGS